ncbi:hypothetical protein [Mangrovibacter phragmitis]|uniref:hypothetical protein n=1 Tax=Mangrovibacter phragmitis TaxID=1691903 RepID=UPI00336A6FFA
MFNSIKVMLPKLFCSGWTLLLFVVVSLSVCGQTGQKPFLVWWLSASGVALSSLSFFLDNRAVVQRLAHRRKVMGWCAWLVLVGALACFWATSFLAVTWISVAMYIAGSLCGFMFSLWVRNKELMKWIQ